MIYRFGPFEFAPDRYALRCDGERVAAEPKVLEVLGCLLAHRGRVVTKEELLEEVWKGSFVSDAALSRAISEVRRALASGPGGKAARRWIQTVYGRGFSYQGPAVEEDAPPDAQSVAAPRASPSLPLPLTPLVGRQAELEEVVELLGSTRLLTLTGTGGTGKTRLALEAARRAAPSFRDGAVFVSLSEIHTGDGLASALALALDVDDPSAPALVAVRRHLSQRQLLLVLDNFEQLVSSAAVVPEVLRSSPESVALVTSRFVLQVEGEQEWPVPPLGLAPPDAAGKDLVSAPAVALFLARARAACPGFEPDDEELAYVAEICRRLDGLPLAIELAAARIKLFSPRALWERLAQRFDLLSSPSRDRHPRHRTLEETLNWSHDLLATEERVLFRRLAVFAGGFPLSAVERVGRLPQPPPLPETTEVLGALVDRSLVVRVAESGLPSEPRFRLLETTRAFALERLREAQEEVAVRRAHGLWVRDLARRAEPELAGGGQDVWLRRLDVEHDNLVAALAFAATGGGVEDGLVTAAALGRYWAARSHCEGRGVLERLLASSTAEEIEPVLRADALVALGMLCHLMSDYPAAEESLHSAIAIFRHGEGQGRLAQCLDHLAWIAAQTTALDRAEELAREALDLHLRSGEERGIAVAHNNLGWVRFFRGDLRGADDHFSRSIDHRRRAADARGVAFMLVNRALARFEMERAIARGWWGPGEEPEVPPPELEEVEGWLEQAGEVIGGLADRPLQSWLDTARALLRFHQGRTSESVGMLRAALAGTGDNENRDGLTWVRLFLGEAEHRAGRADEARATLETALESARELSASWIEAQALHRLADLAADQGRIEEARRQYRRALDLAKERGLSLTATACRQALAAPGSAVQG